MNKKGFFNLLPLIIIGAILVASGAYFAVRTYTHRIPAPISSGQQMSTTTSAIDETAGWKTYRNEEYGFEIWYPRDWNIKETIDNNVARIFNVTSPDFVHSSDEIKINKGRVMTVRVFKSRLHKSLQDLKDAIISDGDVVGTQNTNIEIVGNDRISYDFVYRALHGHGLHILTDSSEIEIGIIAGSAEPKLESRKLFDSIISTLKFTDKKSTNDTFHWKTYTNTQYGLSFQYPADAVISDISDKNNPLFFGISVPFNHSYNTWTIKDINFLVVHDKCDVLNDFSVKTINSINFNVSNPDILDTPVVVSKKRLYETEHNGYCYYIAEKLIGLGPKAKNYPSNELVQIPPNREAFLDEELGTLDQILSTFKFISPTVSGSGVQGTISTYGCPAQRVGDPCGAPYQTTAYIYKGSALYKTISTDTLGQYSVALPAGEYMLTLKNTPTIGSRDVSQTATVKSGSYATLDFVLDNGIR